MTMDLSTQNLGVDQRWRLRVVAIQNAGLATQPRAVQLLAGSMSWSRYGAGKIAVRFEAQK